MSRMVGKPRARGILPKKFRRVELYDPLLKTRILFRTKICNFPYPCPDQKLDTLFIVAGTVAINITMKDINGETEN